MAGESKKLRAWAGYEFSISPGNCTACAERCALVRRDTPCQSCPKFQLDPDHYGLHPANSMPVQMYHLAARDRRAGMNAVLIGTLDPADAWAVINGYGNHFSNGYERQRCFELMTIVDQAATRARGVDEEEARKQAERQAEAKSRRRR